jgi:hypothetical protein
MDDKDAPVSVICHLLKETEYGPDNLKGNWGRTFNAKA